MRGPIENVRRQVRRLTRRYSVMVHAGPESRLRHFTVPGIVVPLCLGIFSLGLAGGTVWFLGSTSARIEREHMEHLRQENERLAQQLETVRRSVGVFEARMEQTAELEQQLRTLANLEPIPEEVRRLGVGGPPAFSELQDEASPSVPVRQARDTLNRLEELYRQAEFQESNFREILSSLRESAEQLDHVPSISPVRTGWFSSRYGNRTDPFTKRMTFHHGLDFSAFTGTPVLATANGRVRKAGRHGTLGLMIEIDHGNGIMTRYGHNSRLLVKVGQEVKRGEVIAEVGSTGRSTSPHCHYEVHVNGRDVNPWRYILDGGPVRAGSGA